MFEYSVPSWWHCLGDVALLEKVCHWGVVFKSLKTHTISSLLILLPVIVGQQHPDFSLESKSPQVALSSSGTSPYVVLPSDCVEPMM